MSASSATRHHSAVLSVSWLPSEAVLGLPKIPFVMGITHYDDPPPEVIQGSEHLEMLRAGAGFRLPTNCKPGSRSRMDASSTTASPAVVAWGSPG